MLNLSPKELRLIAKNRNINGYKSMPKDKLLRIINNNNNNNNGLKIPGPHPVRGIAMSYRQMKHFLALVGNHLEMVSR